MSILIITPLQKEHDALLAGFADYPSAPMTLGKLPATHFPAQRLTLAIGGAGKAQFALQTTHLLDAISAPPELVMCAGASGGLDEGLAAGDVVVGVETVEHDWTNRFNNRPKPRFAGDAETIRGLRALRPTTFDFRVAYGIIASGDEDIITANRRAEVRAQTEALVVAWEGAGGGRACRFHNVPYVEIRGISDSASAGAADEFRANLERVMRNIATLICAWLDA